jgi:phytoene desaturase
MRGHKKAIVIGAGVAGLAASIRLACKGYNVTVIEANAYAGGKLCEFYQDGYRWDAGPSLFTMPENVDVLFTLCGENPRMHFNYQRLDPVAHYWWTDGAQLTGYADPERLAQEVQRKLQEPAQNVLAHLRQAARINRITSGTFLHKSLHRVGTYLTPETWWAILQLPQIDALRTMHTANAARFANPRVVQLFDRYATYNGSDPYRAPATLNIIPHLEFNQGAYFPEGGMVAITNSLLALARRQGVQLLLNTPAQEIIVENKRAVGVRITDETLPADVVVSNMDVTPTYRKLLAHQPAPEKLLAQEKSTSGLIFYWGVDHTFAQLGLHNIFFSADYQAEFAHLFNRKTVGPDPTIYLNISSKYKADDAPPGAENWFVMINTPPDDGTGRMPWDEIIAQARQNILAKLHAMLGTDVSQYIRTEAVLHPRLIEQRTSSLGGSLYGNASNNMLAAFFRHANFSRRIRGLYFCGGSVHPGGGIPLCLLSAKIAADQVPAA